MRSSSVTLDTACHDQTSTLGYLLLGMLSSLVFRAARDALPDNPAAQERIIGASLFAMAVADVRIFACILRAGTYSSSTIRLPSKLK